MKCNKVRAAVVAAMENPGAEWRDFAPRLVLRHWVHPGIAVAMATLGWWW